MNKSSKTVNVNSAAANSQFMIIEDITKELNLYLLSTISPDCSVLIGINNEARVNLDEASWGRLLSLCYDGMELRAKEGKQQFLDYLSHLQKYNTFKALGDVSKCVKSCYNLIILILVNDKLDIITFRSRY